MGRWRGYYGYFRLLRDSPKRNAVNYRCQNLPGLSSLACDGDERRVRYSKLGIAADHSGPCLFISTSAYDPDVCPTFLKKTLIDGNVQGSIEVKVPSLRDGDCHRSIPIRRCWLSRASQKQKRQQRTDYDNDCRYSNEACFFHMRIA